MSYKAFEDFCKNQKIEYKINEPMSEHTSFKIGGPADIFLWVDNENQLIEAIRELKELGIPCFILGKGSNLLVSDKGIEGAVISLAKLNKIEIKGQTLKAQSGASLAKACIAAAEQSLSGLEFAFGIPGTVGGALYMNAGAYGGEMSQVVQSAEYLDSDGEIKTISLSNMQLGYRTSIFEKGEKVILSVTFSLKKGDKEQINSSMNDFLQRRKDKQPLEFPSAGSTFKRPEGYFAGALIEKNNLKGVSVGGAEVSTKHAGFVINKGTATSEDVKKLIELIKNKVFEVEGVDLQTEVIFIGRE